MRSLHSHLLTVLSLGAASLLGATPADAADDSSYGYVRSLEGTAVLHAADARFADAREGADLEAAERSVAINSPLLSQDRLSVESGSRVELVLPDGNVLRLDGRTSASLDALAESADREASATRITLYDGVLQWSARDGFGGAEWPRVDVVNASFYLENGGRFLIESDGDRWSALTVRQGRAEVITQRGSAELRAGESVIVSGVDAPRVERQDAPRLSAIEAWGERLEGNVRWSDLEDIEPRYRYSAASLANYGGWVVVDGRRAWRPSRVRAGWRPFVDGRWVYTPSGWTWISSDPWGWTTSHYGSWDNVPGYGWSWFPGNRYAPAWVYWYWGDGNTGWCPTGYYTRHYRLSSNNFRWGVYGWAGGSWNGYGDWTFCPTRHFRSGNLRAYCGRGSDYFSGRNGVPRGIVTTDTRIVTRDLLGRADGPVSVLSRVHRGAADLPDVTSFVSRRSRDLPIDLGRVIEVPRAARPVDNARSAREPFPVNRGGGVSGSSDRSDRSDRSAGSAGSDRSARPVTVDAPREPARTQRPRAVEPAEPRRSNPPADVWRSREPASDNGREPARIREPQPQREPGAGREPYSPPQDAVREAPVRRVVDGVRTSRPSSNSTPPSSSPTARPSADRPTKPVAVAPTAPAEPKRNEDTGSNSGDSGSSSRSRASQGSGSQGSRGNDRGTARSSDRGQKKDPPARSHREGG